MNPPPNERDEKIDNLIKEFLDKGGKITKVPAGARTEEIEFKGGFYGRKKKKKED